MVAAHLAEDQRCNAPTAIIGMSADSAEISAYTRPFAYLRERSRVADDETVCVFINGDHDRLIEMSKHGLFPPGIVDRIKKLGKSAVTRGVIVGDFNINPESVVYEAMIKHFTDVNAAKVQFHGLCQTLWNAEDVVTAAVMIVDENLDCVEGYKEFISHDV